MILMGMEALIEADLLIKNLNKRGTEIPVKLKKLVSEVSFIVQGKVQDAAPINKGPDAHSRGTLKSSIRIENIGDFSARIFPDENIAYYAEYVMAGTRPHIIEGNPWLSWPGAEHPVRRVWHPGTYPNPFMSYGFEDSQSSIESEVELFRAWITGESDDY